LNDSLETLDDKYDALEELTKGTKEWNAAIREINSSVVELITKYPELAQFVKNEGGVLTLDMDDSGVQGILNKYQTDSILAANRSLFASAKVTSEQLNVERSNAISGKINLTHQPFYVKTPDDYYNLP
jgi:hypothetical protein